MEKSQAWDTFSSSPVCGEPATLNVWGLLTPPTDSQNAKPGLRQRSLMGRGRLPKPLKPVNFPLPFAAQRNGWGSSLDKILHTTSKGTSEGRPTFHMVLILVTDYLSPHPCQSSQPPFGFCGGSSAYQLCYATRTCLCLSHSSPANSVFQPFPNTTPNFLYGPRTNEETLV